MLGMMQGQFSSDYLIAVQKDEIPGHSIIHKFGRNAAVPNGSFEFVNLLGFTAWPLSAPTTVRIKAGGNAADTALGAGAREITVQGIDSNLDETTETIVTAGASASLATSTLFWRVHRTWVSAVGTYGAGNTANIVIENSGGGTDLIQIAATEGQSQFGAFSVARQHTCYILTSLVTVDSTRAANIKLLTRENFNNTTAPMSSIRLRNNWDGISGLDVMPRSPLSPISALSDIWLEAEGSGGETKISVDLEMLLIKDGH